MKKIILILLTAITLASCGEQRAINQYAEIYTYKVYDNLTYRLHFTDEITVTDCAITFVDHTGAIVTIAYGQYKYETLRPFKIPNK